MDFQLWNNFEPAVFFFGHFCLAAQVATATKVKLQIFGRPKVAIAIIFKVALGDFEKSSVLLLAPILYTCCTSL